MNLLSLQGIHVGGDTGSQIWYHFLMGSRECACPNQPLDREGGSCSWTNQTFSLASASRVTAASPGKHPLSSLAACVCIHTWSQQGAKPCHWSGTIIRRIFGPPWALKNSEPCKSAPASPRMTLKTQGSVLEEPQLGLPLWDVAAKDTEINSTRETPVSTAYTGKFNNDSSHRCNLQNVSSIKICGKILNASLIL